MNKLNIYYKYFSLMLLVFFFLVIILPSSVLSLQNNNDKALPVIKLKEVIFFDWESDVNNIANKIPGGKLNNFRSNNSKVYMLDALLEDFDSQVVKISFQRPKDASGNLHTHRWVRIAYNSIDELNSNFNSLIKLIFTYRQNSRYVKEFGKEDSMEKRVALPDDDGSGGIDIRIRKNQIELELFINISRFEYKK